MLTRLYIDNYRTFEAFTWRPGRVALLIGRNGSGKSSLFDLLVALRALVVGEGTVATCFPASSRARWARRWDQTIELDVEIPAGAFTYHLEVRHRPGGEESHVARETLHSADTTLFDFENGFIRLHDDSGRKTAEFKGNWKQSGLEFVAADANNTRLTAFKEWLASVLVARPNPAMMDGRAESENPRLSRNLENFASWYRYTQLSQPDELAVAMAALAEIMPQFRNLTMRVDEQRIGWLRANFDGPDGQPYALRFEELSDGQRVLIALYTLLSTEQRRPRTLVLDEPDNFVALDEIQPLLFQFLDRAMAETGAQLFVASHHPEYLDHLAPDHGWVLDRPTGDVTRIARFTADVALSASSLVARGELSAAPRNEPKP